MTEFALARMNEQWDIVLPDFREEFWRVRPNWERGRMEHCAQTMKPGMTVIDCGAEHGDMTTMYRKWVQPYGHVIPVEPGEHFWPFIRGTFLANGFTEPPIVSWPGFVGDKTSGRRVTCNNTWPTCAFDNGVADGGFFHLRDDKRHSSIRLDDLCAINALHPDVIVIDTEGSEFKVLEGCGNVLVNDKPLVYVSVHDVGDDAGWSGPLLGWYRKTVDDIHNLMGEFGYSWELLPGHGEGERFFCYSP